METGVRSKISKLIVAADFSLPAENAVQYALSLASELGAKVIIVHARNGELPKAENLAERPVLNDAALVQGPHSRVDTIIRNFLENSCGDQKSRCPEPVFRTEEGRVADVLADVTRSEGADLLVMGLSGAGGLVNFILGSHAIEMCSKASIPVMLIPFKASYSAPVQIAYASDFQRADALAISFLTVLASALNSRVTIFHVGPVAIFQEDPLEKKGKCFAAQMRRITGFNRIDFEPVWNSKIRQGLQWISDQPESGIISLLHRKKGRTMHFFKQHQTEGLAHYSPKPLLVFPWGVLESWQQENLIFKNDEK